jgi:osmotically-inducible protein OsmY
MIIRECRHMADKDRWRDEDRERYGRPGEGRARGMDVGYYGGGYYGGGQYRGDRDRDREDPGRRGGFGQGGWGREGRELGGAEDYGRGSSYAEGEGRGYGGGYSRDYGGGYGREGYGGRYGREGYGGQGGHGGEERGFWERASDEVASWFGDEGAERRRQQDHRGRGPKGYRRSDERIRDDVSDRLSDDPFVDASEIEVSVQNGEVTLSGTVDSRNARRRAEDLVENVSGVTHVQNNLRVRQQGASATSGYGTTTSTGTSGGGTATGTTGATGGSGAASTATAGTGGSTSGSDLSRRRTL